MDTLLDDGVDGMFTNHTATLRARVDARTGHAARRPVTFERGCPGVAGTVTAASTAASAVPTVNRADDPGARQRHCPADRPRPSRRSTTACPTGLASCSSSS